MNRRKLLLYSGAALIAVVASSVGGFLYFRNSSDWSDIRALISDSPLVVERVGRVRSVSFSPLGLSYRSSGGWAHARLVVNVEGDKGNAKFDVELDRFANVWTLKRISET